MDLLHVDLVALPEMLLPGWLHPWVDLGGRLFLVYKVGDHKALSVDIRQPVDRPRVPPLPQEPIQGLPAGCRELDVNWIGLGLLLRGE